MNEQNNNNNIGSSNPQMPQKQNKDQKVVQSGKDLGQMGLKAAGNAIGGPVGGMVANKIANSKLGQNALNRVGQNMAKNPMMNNALSKASPGLQKAKPAMNATGGGLGGSKNSSMELGTKTGGTSNGSSQETTTDNKKDSGSSNKSTSSQSNNSSSNSGFGNNKSGLFSNPFKLGGDAKGEGSKNPLATFKKTKKVIGIVAAVAPIIFPIIMGILVIVIVMAQIMTVRDQIQQLARQFTTGVEKLVNFAQGDGWMTNEDSFFKYLDKEYNKFSSTVNSGSAQLDIPLIAATVHYSKVGDLEQYGELNADNSSYSEEDFSVLGSALTKDNTASFYKIAKDKLGSVNTLWPGQKRLLGHIVKTEVSVEWIDIDAAGSYWSSFFSYFNQTIASTIDDAYWNTPIKYGNVVTAIPAFIDTYSKAKAYYDANGNIFGELTYDGMNLWYEAGEFINTFAQLFNDSSGLSKDENGSIVGKEDQNGILKFPCPVLKRTMNYGYSEFKEMKKIVTEMRAIIKDNTLTDDSLYKQAKNSSDENLQALAKDYETNKNKYLYSYTHYLKEVYIPFTYFYKKNYTDGEVNSIIDEIYDQRDLYNYLIDEVEGDVCIGGTQAGNLAEMSREEKINMIGPIAQLEYSRTGILASITIAQAILESDIGASTPAGSNNMFGIKCGSWPKENCVSAKTSEEYTPGNVTTETALFRKYDSIEASIQDHTNVLLNGLYKGITETTDYKEQAAIIKKGGYATASDYTEQLISLIKYHDLTKWDVSVNSANSSLMCGPVVSGGWTIRTTTPTSADIPYTYVSSNRGQCVWYVRARSIEIAQDLASKGKITTEQMEKIKSLLLNNVGGNAEAWYRSGSLYFNSSNNINNLKAGSIIVWSGGSNKCSPKCGHVAIIEEVTTTEVIFTDGWATGGSSCPNNWNCVNFRSKTMSISEFLTGAKNNFGSHSGSMKFEGYVYFLEPL